VCRSLCDFGFDARPCGDQSIQKSMEPRVETSEQVTKGYHGTTHQEAQEILKTYFKLTPPDSGSFLGEGVYFFENQLSQAQRWALLKKGVPGTKVCVVASDVRYGRVLNLTDKNQRDDLMWFAQEYQRRSATDVTLSSVIDIVAEKLNIEVVKAIRVPNNPTFMWGSRFSADVENILAVRRITNILSKEVIWTQVRGAI